MILKPKCCECGKRVATIPWSKRGDRLTWVCRACFYVWGYDTCCFVLSEEAR